jgi:hypothetical protein
VVIFLTSCAPAVMHKPPTPTLTIIERPDGGISLDRENARLLGQYIQALEAGYP